MTFLATVRTQESYYEKIKKKSPQYQIAIKQTHKRFNDYCMETFDRSCEDVIQEMKRSNEDAIYDTLQSWINWNDKPNSIVNYFAHMKPYLHYRGIKLNPMDIKLNLDFGKKTEEELHPLSQEEYKKLLLAASYRNKVFYLFMGSSGMRPVEACHIRKKDLEFKERIVIHIPAKWTKLKRARTTFCSKEVSEFIKPMLEKIGPEDVIFPYSFTSAIDVTFGRYRKKTGLDKVHENNKRALITPMSFRAWFISKISRHDPNLAKKWSGQKGYLLQYDRMTQEEQLEKYLEFEPDLLVYTNKEDPKVKKDLENVMTELANVKREMAKYKEHWDENVRLATDEEYKRKEIEPLTKKILKRFKEELREELLEEIKTPKVAKSRKCPTCSQESHDKIGNHYKCLNPDCEMATFQV